MLTKHPDLDGIWARLGRAGRGRHGRRARRRPRRPDHRHRGPRQERGHRTGQERAASWASAHSVPFDQGVTEARLGAGTACSARRLRLRRAAAPCPSTTKRPAGLEGRLPRRIRPQDLQDCLQDSSRAAGAVGRLLRPRGASTARRDTSDERPSPVCRRDARDHQELRRRPRPATTSTSRCRGRGPRPGRRQRRRQVDPDEDPPGGLPARRGGRSRSTASPSRSPRSTRREAAGIGMIFQEFSLVPTLTVAQNIFLDQRAARPRSACIDDREARAPGARAVRGDGGRRRPARGGRGPGHGVLAAHRDRQGPARRTRGS